MSKIFILILLFFSCVVSPRYKASTYNSSTPKTNKYKKTKLASNKKIQTGISSWYGPNFHGKLTANGETFNMYAKSAAHNTLPLGTVVRVTNLDNEKSIILTINDRGPFAKNRILDCSAAAAKELDFYVKGTAPVSIEVIQLGDNKYYHRNIN